MVGEETTNNTTQSQISLPSSGNFPQPHADQETPKKEKMIRSIFFLILASLIALITAYMFLSNTFSPKKAEISNKPPKQPIVTKPEIKIAVNPWKASELNANIAKIILQENMGFPVKLVPIDENSQWEA